MLEFLKWHLLSIIIGFVLDLCFGDPVYRWHPVRMIGSMISQLESHLYKMKNRLVAGTLLWIFSTSIPVLLWAFLALLLPPVPLLVLSTLLYYTLFSFRDLVVHFDRVKIAVEKGDLTEARRSVSMIVGRETENLTLSQCATAAIESLSENSSDGGVSPLFWALVGGVPGLLLFKVSSTLDSMVGYRNEKYEQFGKVSAKIDDVLNFVPARLTAILFLVVGKCGRSQLKTFMENRNHHDSPNAGQVESAMAVATNCKMGGGAYYHGKWVDKHTINPDGDKASFTKMNRARAIVTKLYVLLFALIATLSLSLLIM